MLWRLLDCCNTNPITFKIINLCTYQKGRMPSRGVLPFPRLPYAHFALSTVDRLRGEFSVCHDKEDAGNGDGNGNGNGSCLPSGGIFSSSCALKSGLLFPPPQALSENGRFKSINMFISQGYTLIFRKWGSSLKGIVHFPTIFRTEVQKLL